METNSQTLELTVLSAGDLRINNRNLKKNAFVVVSIDPFKYRITKTDAQGGGYPTWNEKFVMDLPARERFIILEVKCSTSSGDRRVGGCDGAAKRDNKFLVNNATAAVGMRKFQIDGTGNFSGVVRGIPVWSVTR
ncbi:hypothetical protein SLEP1_g57007 [Rubroshorea leprosula]|uniref:C2 domain-containing protein n=1 Tax=Rubroshorea leprosula TaxID=152421 RepID=A0AAV5MMC0_9ROSI|nr:hypothetical protein SLEP1_g57007 [Rubroshorea leprosula]